TPIQLPVSTRGVLNAPRGRLSPIQVEVILLPVCRSPLLELMYLVRGGDTESLQRQDHGTNTNMRRRRWANLSTVRAPEYWRADIPLGSNLLKCRIQIVAQRNHRFERHVWMPLIAQPLDHFPKPHFLCVAGGHE
ncbi:MAG TPA: hypothetical protein VGL72_24450, partial [Bryobacteraceae bacterium]